MMRTTLTLDEQLFHALQDAAHRSGKPFKWIVNEALRLGLHTLEHPQAQCYTLEASSMGAVRPGINLDKALGLADEMADGAIAIKLELRK